MSNHHLQDKRLSLKAKGLLSYMLSLPDDWDYSLKGLTTGCRDGIDSVRSAVHELEDGGYLCRSKVRDARGRIIDYNYEVFELPQKERIEKRPAPVPNSPSSENPMSGFPTLENPTQQNTNKQNTKKPRAAVIGSRGHFCNLKKGTSHRNLQAKISRFLRNDVRKSLFHTGRQRLHFRCSCVRCPLEICSAAVAVPAHSRLPCLNAAFPESREMLRFLLPALG